ncbi:mitochondrial carrier domain-containing protein [Neohortaea acidophila]|uniref:Mitochondrial carrier domain-containing protein n=1 Tax=Neohortaea acidophila TaxID=245834 RepID=A0A6A6PJA8_9PEZI|nr:mitochondrial carrier domain-containing protein [Neohortaea acidophila]KAF2480005.1 mitochondrial carrier domain-containing protein [Neohortaea acidophila]
MPSSDDKNDSNDAKSEKPQPSPADTIFFFQPSHKVKRFAKKYRTEIAASTSSVLSTFFAFPLDFTKSRMQSYETGFLHTVKDAYRAEGLRAFWRGVTPPVISVTLVRTISFSVYQRAKYAYDRTITNMTGQSPLVLANAPGSYPSLLTISCFGAAGATAGAVITTLSCPFELTKLNEQLAGKEARNSLGSGKSSTLRAGSWATAKRLVKDRGFSGLYSGYRLHLLRDTIGTSIYFMTYESTKQLMSNARGRSPTSPYAVVVAGGMCGIVSWACIYPIDVAKTLYQKSLLSAGSGVAKRPRINFFGPGSYRGLFVSVLRSCIINAVFFSNFEFLKKRINALEG